MPIFDAVANANGFPPNGISVSHALGQPSGNNRVVLVGASGVGPGPHTVVNCTYNGVAMNSIIQQDSPTYFGRVSSCKLFYLLDADLPASAGTYTASINFINAYAGSLGVISYYNASQAVVPGAMSSGHTNPSLSGLQTTNITTTASAGTIVDFFGGEADGATSSTAASPQVQRVNTVAVSMLFVSDKDFSSAGANSMGQTPNGNYWSYVHILAEIAALGGPAAVDNAPIIGMNF